MTLENKVSSLIESVNSWYRDTLTRFDSLTAELRGVFARLNGIESHYRRFDYVCSTSEAFSVALKSISDLQATEAGKKRRYSLFLSGFTSLPLDISASNVDIHVASAIVFEGKAFVTKKTGNIIHGGSYRASLGEGLDGAKLRFLYPITHEGADVSKVTLLNRIDIDK